jgi:hypothetical protein
MPSSTYDSCPTDTTTSTITLIANTTSISYFTSFADITAVPSSPSSPSSSVEASSSIVELESSYWVPDTTSSSSPFSSSFSSSVEVSTTAQNPLPVHTHTHQQNPDQNPRHTHTRYQNPQPLPTSSYIESSSEPGVPVTIATGTCLHPETSIEQTATVSGTPHSGTANPKAYHCGLHGLPVGDLFLARFVQDEDAPPMTVVTCYKYCTVRHPFLLPDCTAHFGVELLGHMLIIQPRESMEQTWAANPTNSTQSPEPAPRDAISSVAAWPRVWRVLISGCRISGMIWGVVCLLLSSLLGLGC